MAKQGGTPDKVLSRISKILADLRETGPEPFEDTGEESEEELEPTPTPEPPPDLNPSDAVPVASRRRLPIEAPGEELMPRLPGRKRRPAYIG